MAKIKNIQSGVKTLASSSQSDTVTIDSVTLNKSIVRVSYSGGGDRDARHILIYAQLTGTTEITFERYETAGSPQDTTIEWQVIEYESGVNVQRDTYTVTATTSSPIDITISAVTLANAFPILHYWSGYNWEVTGADCIRTDLTSTTNLRLVWDRGVSLLSGMAKYGWQVVEHDDCDVNLYTEVVSGTSDSETIPSVDEDKTMLITSFGTNAGSGFFEGREMWMAALASSTLISYDTYVSSGDTTTFNTWVVEFTDDTVVNRYTASMSTSETSDTVAISISDIDNAWVNPTNCLSGGNGCKNSKADGYNQECAFISAEIDSTTALIATRYSTGSASVQYTFEIVEPDSGTSIPLYMHHYTKNQG